MDITTGPNPDIQTQDSPVGDQLQAPAQAPVQQPMQLQPSQQAPAPQSQPFEKPGSFFHAVAHSIGGALLGAAAGPDPVQYSRGADGKMVAQTQPSTTGDKFRRIAQAALTGLAAGAQVQPRKSGAADALAGLGAGAGAEMEKEKEQDQTKRKQADDDFEKQQQEMINKHNIAHQNALTVSTHFGNIKAKNDLNPIYAENESLMKSALASPELSSVTAEMTDQQVDDMQKNDPHFMATHILKPLGWAPVTDKDGNPVLDADGQPQQYMRVGVIDGTKNGNIGLTPEMIQNIHQYGDAAQVANAKNLKVGDEIPLQKWIPLMNAVDGERKNVLQGWHQSTIGWQTDADGKEVPVEINGYDKKLIRPFEQGTVPAAAKEEKAKEAKELAQGAQADATAVKDKAEAIKATAEAAQIAQQMKQGGGNDAEMNSAYMQAIQNLPAKSQAVLRSVPRSQQGALLTVANGDAKLNEVFPTRVTKGSGQLDAAHATSLLQEMRQGWNAELYTAKQSQMKEFTSGKSGAGAAINSFNQLLVHLNEVKQASENLQRTNSPAVNAPINEIKNKYFGQPGVPELMTAISTARSEWETLIKSGHAPTAEEVSLGKTIMSDTSSPSQILGASQMMARTGVARLDQVNEQWKTAWGTNFPNLIHPSGASAAQSLGIGNDISKYSSGGVLQSVQPNSQSGQPAAQNSPAPQTHVFDSAAWAKANPSGDVNAAKAAAQAQGYEVK